MNHPAHLAAALLLSFTFVGCQSDAPATSDKSTVKASTEPMRVYVGTYTGKESKGIYMMELDPKTGSLTEPKLAAEVKSPSFLAHDGKFLYAVSEIDTFDGKKTGGVSAFSMNDDGTLKLLNQQPSGGTGPCHLDVGTGGSGAKAVLVANYGSGSIELLPVNQDGSLKPPASVVQHEGSSVDKRRQEGPHAHCITIAPPTKSGWGRALVADLGLDKIMVYRFDSSGTLKPNDPPSAPAAPGAGPRHLAFGDDSTVYVNNEMASTVTRYAYDINSGKLDPRETLSTLPAGFDGSKNSTAEIAVHPSEKFVYVSNRGHDSVAIFKVDEKTGKLTAAGHQTTGGKTPRNFGIEPGGRFLLAANQNSGTVVVFRIDPKSGALAPTGATAAVPSPVCVVFTQK